MKESDVKIRLMRDHDFNIVVGIEEKALNVSRMEYYELKFEKLFKSKDYLPVSLVAEEENGPVVGFVIGELFMGEDGVFPKEATLDDIGVDPGCRHKDVGDQLINAFIDHLRKLGVQKINTLVDSSDSKLMDFFGANKFFLSKTINMERNL